MVFWMILGALLILSATAGIAVYLARQTIKRMKGSGPSRTMSATVVGKRTHTSRQAYCRTCAVQPDEMSTSYYVTFQFDNGRRLELRVPPQQVGYLIEGDKGLLTFQGVVYQGFRRI